MASAIIHICVAKKVNAYLKQDEKETIYNDYTDMNIKLIDEYNLYLSLFYEDFDIPNTNINEIPIDKLNILIDRMKIIIIIKLKYLTTDLLLILLMI